MRQLAFYDRYRLIISFFLRKAKCIEKTFGPRSMYGPRPRASVLMQDLGHSFSEYGPPGQQITYLFLFSIYFYWNFDGLLVTNSLLSAGGQDGKIPPAHETPRNQSDYWILFILPARAPKKKDIIIICNDRKKLSHWKVSIALKAVFLLIGPGTSVAVWLA